MATSQEFEQIKNRKLLPNTNVVDLARRDEPRLLSLLMKDRDMLDDALVYGGITWRSFLIPENAGMLFVIGSYYGKYGAMLTRDAFRSIMEENHGQQVAAQYVNLFNSYLATAVSKDDYGKLKDGLLNRAAQQKFFEACDGGNAFMDVFKSTSGQRDQIGSLISKLQEMQLESADNVGIRVRSMRETLDSLSKNIALRRDSKPSERGYVCGLKAIDDMFMGFRKGKYGIILGFPNGGKTSLLINFAYRFAMVPYKVCYITIESDDEEVGERTVALASGISGKRMKKGGRDKEDGLDDDTFQRLLVNIDDMKVKIGDSLTYITVPQLTPVSKILALAERQRRLNGMDVLIIDYLDVVGRETSHPNRPDLELADMSVAIQAWGKRTHTSVWTAQSIGNTKIREFRKNEWVERPEESYLSVGVEDMGGSQKLSRDPDYILAVVPHPNRDRLFIYVTKSRYDTAAGQRCCLSWDPDTCLIEDYDRFVLSTDKVHELQEKWRAEDARAKEEARVKANLAGIAPTAPAAPTVANTPISTTEDVRATP